MKNIPFPRHFTTEQSQEAAAYAIQSVWEAIKKSGSISDEKSFKAVWAAVKQARADMILTARN